MVRQSVKLPGLKIKNCSVRNEHKCKQRKRPFSEEKIDTVALGERREFIVHVCVHTAKEVCGSSVMKFPPVDSGVSDASTMPWLLVGPAVPHLPKKSAQL
ncbi:hypothetical protein TNCV_4025491 [Trichonephila clavipes]|nr:hypothetical protein TNCV_4025491 [Trichonephila clavipes]